MMDDVTRLLSAKGPFVGQIEGYTVRSQQQELAQMIFASMRDKHSVICEAGTGTGKTFAYLLPAMLSDRRVIISTGTKNLQDQLYYKDLPVVRQALNIPVKTALLKGRSNYLCLERSGRDVAELRLSKEQLSDIAMVKKWAKKTHTGDLAELTDLAEDSNVLSYVVSNKENCLGQGCSFYDDCFLFKARRKASDAEIIVVNHHLLLADLALRESGFGEILPKVDTIIFDEAHHLPALASESFGQTLSSRQFKELLRDTKEAYLTDANDMAVVLDNIRLCQTGLSKLRLSFGHSDQRTAWADLLAIPSIGQALQDFHDNVSRLNTDLEKLAERSKALDHCWRRASTMVEKFSTFVSAEVAEDMIQWLETRGQGFLLHQTPIDIAAEFQGRLAQYDCNSVYISATLSVAKDFSHFATQLGLSDLQARSWDSPFDYQRQALLYLPQNMPQPGQSAAYTTAFVDVALEVIKLSQGRAFLLFTSHLALQAAYRLMADKIPYQLLRQGDAPRSELLASFRAQGNSVLFATSSFWEGVDVRGSALACVIIDKLPFAPPDDPVFQARAARMKENGQNPFMEYQVPRAIVSLQQGVGRLIRDQKDYGVLVICDPRLKGKFYGKYFLKSLPDMRQSTDINDVQEFFLQQDNTTNCLEGAPAE